MTNERMEMHIFKFSSPYAAHWQRQFCKPGTTGAFRLFQRTDEMITTSRGPKQSQKHRPYTHTHTHTHKHTNTQDKTKNGTNTEKEKTDLKNGLLSVPWTVGGEEAEPSCLTHPIHTGKRGGKKVCLGEERHTPIYIYIYIYIWQTFDVSSSLVYCIFKVSHTEHTNLADCVGCGVAYRYSFEQRVVREY